MGYIPIFVALLAVVLLYTGYTYNLIKPRKARLTQVIDRMAKNSSNRKNIVLTYDSQNQGSALAEVANLLKKTSTDRFQSYRKEEELMSAIDGAINDLSDDKVSSDLKESNSTQQGLIEELKSVSNDYNSFIKKAPASMVASVFGFRQF